MRRRVIAAGVLLALVVLATSCAASTPRLKGVLPSRVIVPGSVTITVTPTRLDDRGANFAIILDTHSGELSTDLAATTSLEVGGRAWPTNGWNGDGPSGHHRSGELRFKPGGPAQGTARLTIRGFDERVVATWKLPSR